MKRFSRIFLITMISLLFVPLILCVGCSRNNDDNDASAELAIVEIKPLAVIEPYKEFDMNNVFVQDDGVSYSFEGFYSTTKGSFKDIVFNGSKFKISADDAEIANITITAEKGDQTVSKELSLTVDGKLDVVDNGYIQLWKEDYVAKSANYNPAYVKDGNSSIKVTCNGYYTVEGSQFANLLGHLATVDGGIYDTDYFSIYQKANQEDAWKDAVMTYWVYYSGAPKGHEDVKLEIGYRFAHNTYEQLPKNAQRDFDFTGASIKECNLGEWTQIAIRLKDVYKTTPLFLDWEQWRTGNVGNDNLYDICDIVNFKCRLYSEEYESRDRKYIYSFYFYGGDILTYDDFTQKYPDYEFEPSSIPPLQENENEDTTVIRSWENEFTVENWRNSGKGISFDYSFVNPASSAENDAFWFFESVDGEWHRLTNQIAIDFNNKVADCGKVIDLGNGKFRYELMFSDAPINMDDGQEASGNEKANLIYFVEYPTVLNVSNFQVIDQYSV